MYQASHAEMLVGLSDEERELNPEDLDREQGVKVLEFLDVQNS